MAIKSKLRLWTRTIEITSPLMRSLPEIGFEVCYLMQVLCLSKCVGERCWFFNNCLKYFNQFTCFSASKKLCTDKSSTSINSNQKTYKFFISFVHEANVYSQFSINVETCIMLPFRMFWFFLFYKSFTQEAFFPSTRTCFPYWIVLFLLLYKSLTQEDLITFLFESTAL